MNIENQKIAIYWNDMPVGLVTSKLIKLQLLREEITK